MGIQRVAIGRPRKAGQRHLRALDTARPRAAYLYTPAFVALSCERLKAWLSRPLEPLDLPVLMIDAIHFRSHIMLIVLGIDTEGRKHVLGMRQGATENTAVVRELIADLIERGLNAEAARLIVIDGARALRRAIAECFGGKVMVQRCQVHKLRNVREHLPQELHASVKKAMSDAWACTDAEFAKRQLERLARSLERSHPSAARSIRKRTSCGANRSGSAIEWGTTRLREIG